ncbi:hypothetical protein KAJ27_06490 [bacterium]|nr:hypothetical protein [bacterium]
MKKNFIRSLYFFLIPFVLLMQGCPYASTISLEVPGNSTINQALLGEWEYNQEGIDGIGTLKIYKFNEREYLLEASEKDETVFCRVFETLIEGVSFLNIQQIGPGNEENEFVFTKYYIQFDKLYLVTLEDNVLKEQFNTSTEFMEFVKSHIDNPELFGKVIILDRK